MRLPGESTGVYFGLDSFDASATSAGQVLARCAPPFHREVARPYGMTTWIVLMVFAVVAAVAFVLFAILTLRWLALLIDSRRHIERLCRGGGIRIETKRRLRRKTKYRLPQAASRGALKTDAGLVRANPTTFRSRCSTKIRSGISAVAGCASLQMTRSRRAHRRTSIVDAP